MGDIRLFTLGDKLDDITLEEMEEELRGGTSQTSRTLVNVDRCESELEMIKGSKDVPVEIKYIADLLSKPKTVWVPRPDCDERLLSLRDKIPIAAPLLDLVGSQLDFYFATCKRRGFQMMPLLLVGKPGIGKTWATQRIADAIGIESFKIELSNGNEGFFLSGSQRGYTNSTPGEVARNLAYVNCANPIGILDEIDKGNFNDTYRPPLTGPLLSLLEPDTATRFSDASLRIEIDTSMVSWIATANELEKIPDPILSRFHIITFNEPTMKDMKKIMSSIAREVLREYRLTQSITIDCSEGFLEKALSIPSRAVQRCMILALTRNTSRIVDEYFYKFTEDDLKAVHKPVNEPRRIGFIL